MQDRPPQNAKDAPRHRPQRVRCATFRFAGPARFGVIRLAAGIGPGTQPWLRMRTTAGLAAVLLGLADGRSTNTNTPCAPAAPRQSRTAGTRPCKALEEVETVHDARGGVLADRPDPRRS